MRAKLGDQGLISDDKRAILSVTENARTYRILNPRGLRLLCYRVDGGMLISGRRCDYAIGVTDDMRLFLVELKGKNLREAAAQLLATLDVIAHRVQSCSVHARVVLSKFPRPDLRASTVIALERKLASWKGSFKRQCRELDETL